MIGNGDVPVPPSRIPDDLCRAVGALVGATGGLGPLSDGLHGLALHVHDRALEDYVLALSYVDEIERRTLALLSQCVKTLHAIRAVRECAAEDVFAALGPQEATPGRHPKE